MKRLVLLACAALVIPSMAMAQRSVDPNAVPAPVTIESPDGRYFGLPANPFLTFAYKGAYQLLGIQGSSGSSSTTTGGAVGPVPGGNYNYRVTGTFAGCTVNLQFLDADGVSWVTTDSETAAATKAISFAQQPLGVTTANVRTQMTGCTGTPSLWAYIGGVY